MRLEQTLRCNNAGKTWIGLLITVHYEDPSGNSPAPRTITSKLAASAAGCILTKRACACEWVRSKRLCCSVREVRPAIFTVGHVGVDQVLVLSWNKGLWTNRSLDQQANMQHAMHLLDMLELEYVSTWQILADHEPLHKCSFDLHTRCEPRKTQDNHSRVDYLSSKTKLPASLLSDTLLLVNMASDIHSQRLATWQTYAQSPRDQELEKVRPAQFMLHCVSCVVA